MAFIKMKASEVKEFAIKRQAGLYRFIDKCVEERKDSMTVRQIQDYRRSIEHACLKDLTTLSNLIHIGNTRPEDDLYIREDRFKMLTEKQLFRGEEI